MWWRANWQIISFSNSTHEQVAHKHLIKTRIEHLVYVNIWLFVQPVYEYSNVMEQLFCIPNDALTRAWKLIVHVLAHGSNCDLNMVRTHALQAIHIYCALSNVGTEPFYTNSHVLVITIIYSRSIVLISMDMNWFYYYL